jgi:hypothetical protein
MVARVTIGSSSALRIRGLAALTMTPLLVALPMTRSTAMMKKAKFLGEQIP